MQTNCILQQETRQSWRTNLCYSHAYENESGFGRELNLDLQLL